MKKLFSRRPLTVDPAHMITLHQEAIEQLELMNTVVEASEHASDGMHDTLTRMAENHWEAYLDVLHMICMHEESFAAVMKKHGFATHDNEPVDTEQRQFFGSRALIMALLLGLIRRHRRFAYFYSLRANPMGEYIKESVAMEREHIVEMIGMVQNMM
ncbi:hypothetical protein [Sporomusa sp. KB1]|jgi:hypothetical protein|uniref:hypothetical protein n=1 Tax=Sporomusa sp. KB1 TaxID=943346 RepID=UPI0011ADCBDF|nr:hypothetical protein [Sporomusa sp. KB1]TWH49527.1 hypothetical protein Salpa_5758 [Sporomusa sp. KB1]